MKALIALSLALVLAFSTAQAQTELAPARFQQELAKEPNAQVLDVRTPGEYKQGHLQGAKNLDIFHDDFDKQLASLDKTRPVYVYCLGGGRSAEAAEKMQKMGFKKVVDMEGGFRAWQDKGLPVAKDEAVAPAITAKIYSQQELEGIITSGKPAIIDFYAPWCKPCKEMAPALEQLQKEGVTVYKVDYDANRTLANQQGVSSIPTVFIVKKGKIALRMEGAQTKERMKEALKN